MQIAAGGLTLAAMFAARRDARVLDAYLVAVAVVGGGLAWTDATFFAGTAYLATKHVIGLFAGLSMAAWLFVRVRGASWRRALLE
jgi:hypothetical protein